MLQLPMWMLAATLCQAPPDASWLDSVPAEADVVVRVRGVKAVRDDLVAMLKAMSPALAEKAVPGLEQQAATFEGKYGEKAATGPFLTLLRIVKPDNPAQPPFAVVVKSDDYEGVLKSAAGDKAPKLQPEIGGFDSFDGQSGQTWYAAKAGGHVAFGPDKTLIAGFAKPGGKSLGKTLAPTLQKSFFAGDVGVYVNAKELTARYSDQIDQAKQGLMAALDQASQQVGAGMMDAAKGIYGGMFDSLKVADVVVFNLDAAAEGLSVGGELTVKTDSGKAGKSAKVVTGDASGLAKLPADAAYFAYMNLDARTFHKLQMMGLRMMAPGGKPTPELEAAVAQLKGIGGTETLGATSIGDGGLQSFNVTNTSDPGKLLAASEATLKAMRGIDGPLSFFKELTVTPKAETYKGFTFNRVVMKIDLDKLAKTQPGNPSGAAGMKAMFGGDSVTSWYGVDDKRMIQITAPSWDKAKSRIDAFLKGDDGLGATAGFKAVRAKLPKQVSVLALFSAQGMARQFASQFAAMANAPKPKLPDDLPKDPALVGLSLTPTSPNGFEFHLVVPSSVGPVIEKGMVPAFSNLRPPVAQ